MAKDVELGCRCGEIGGWIRAVSPNAVNRAVCYCDDCQAYLHHLGRAELLDVHGGTDIVQVAPSTVSFERGAGLIAGLRLTPKGLHRWYARCCHTPLGNTLTPTLPLIGIPWEAFRGTPDAASRDEVFGKVRLAGFAQFAIDGIADGLVRTPPSYLFQALWRMLGWKLRGNTWPHPFFARDTRTALYPITVLSPAEREALRAKCGPHPSGLTRG